MKKIQTLLFLSLAAILVLGCVAEPQGPIEITRNGSTSVLTKSGEPRDTHYYWYRGETIPLTVNLEYINILLSDPEMDNAGMEELCQEMHLQVITDFRDGGLVKVRLDERSNGLDEYDVRTRSIRKDPRIKGVYPYFERGGNAEPIGTSNVFYLKLKGEGVYDPEPMQQMAEEYGVTIVKEVPYMPDWYILSIEGSSFENSLDATNAFYESDLFADVDPAFMFNFQPCTVNDPYYSQQWGLNNTTYPDYDINVEGAWALSTGNGATIAIFDHGIDTTHPDLAANMSAYSYNAKRDSVPNTAVSVHGTYVAGIAAAVTNNNAYIAGVAKDSKIMDISHTLLPSQTFASELASGFSFAWQNGADVISNSWGTFEGSSAYSYMHSYILENAIANAMTLGRNGLGSVVVFASGNTDDNGQTIAYPAKSDNRIVVVGSIESTGYRAWGSGYASELDVVAPGVDIWSTIPGSSVAQYSGTSAATPHVAGVAALMIAANPDLTREEVVRLIEVTAKKIHTENYQYYSYRPHSTWNQEVGYGLIDATKAVSLAWHKGQTNPSNNPAVDFYIPIGATTYSDGTIVINSFPTIQAFFYVPTSLENMSYTYYWYYTLSGDPYWSPTYYYYGYTSGIQMTIPRPNSNSILSLTCEVFNGSTYVCTVHRDFHVLPNFPS